MSQEQFTEHFKAIHAQIAMLHEYMMSLTPEQQEQIGEIGDTIASSLDSLEVAYERMETSLDVSDVIEQELLEQSESGFIQYQRYYDLFYFAPDACLLTDTKGLILEANQAAAMLLNVPHHYLMGKPLVVYVPAVERHLVELHGGTIHATSPGVGQGATFSG
jgi:PAS domain-containing protein